MLKKFIRQRVASISLCAAICCPVALHAEGINDCSLDGALDCIIITQSADTKGVAANSAIINLSGSLTTILPISQITQAGDGNSALFDILGSQNTIYFAQTGNSTVTMHVDGINNLVSLSDFGGNVDRAAVFDLDLSGQNNSIAVTASAIGAVAQLLEIDMINSTDAFVQLSYDDFSEITATIIGENSDVTVVQENADSLADASNRNSVTLHVDSVAKGNILALQQIGTNIDAEITISGTSNDLDIYQRQGLESANSLVLDLHGNNNSGRISLIDSFKGQSFNARVNGAYNNFDYEVSVEGLPSTLEIEGSGNTVYAVGTGNNVGIIGSENYVGLEAYSDEEYTDTSHYVDVSGDGNNVDVLWDGWEHKKDNANAQIGPNPSSNSDILGDSNTVRLQLGELLGNDLDQATFSTDIIGYGNTVLGSSTMDFSYDLEQDYVIVNIDGDDNHVDYGDLGPQGLEVDLTGDDNFVLAWHTSDVDINLSGNNNYLEYKNSEFWLESTINVDMNGGKVIVNNSYSDYLFMNLEGERNTASVQNILDINLFLTMTGKNNAFSVDGGPGIPEQYGLISGVIDGNHNSVNIGPLQAGKHASIEASLYGNGNDLVIMGLQGSYFDESQFSAVISGSGNTIDILTGDTASLVVDGDGFDLNLSFREDAGVYYQVINNVGLGEVQLVTDDGSVSFLAL